MIQAANFMRQAQGMGLSLFTGVPCSYLKPFINYTLDAKDLTYVGAANEAHAVAIASGAHLAGRRSAVMLQNSGFGNAVNPLTSLNAIFRIPVLLIVTWRGEPGGAADEPQHELMGQITPALFDVMRLPWTFFPDSEAEIETTLSKAIEHMDRTGLPFGLIMKKDSVAPHALQSKPCHRPWALPSTEDVAWPTKRHSRSDILRLVQANVRATDAIVATTGHTGRALYALADKPNQFYMVGSMGCASSLALGLALAQPQRRVIVLDGDGAALMHLGALATIGFQRPPNLLHVLLDNETHESTGGQSTVSHSVDLAAVAQACGYERTIRASSLDVVADVLKQPASRLTFVHVKTQPDEATNLPRPTVSPRQVAERFRDWLSHS